jgi:membrane-associated phospholipid phosphatase
MTDIENNPAEKNQRTYESIEVESNQSVPELSTNNYQIDCYKNDALILKKFIIWAICVVICCSIELIYNRGLLSQEHPKYYRNVNAIYDYYFRFITHLGGELFIIFIMVLSYFFLPLTKSNVMILGIISCNFLDNLMKMLYHEHRPFWNFETKHDPPKCDMGFGHPSGHSFTSTFTYLGLYHVLSETNFLKNHIILNYIFLAIVIIIIVSIYISRVYLNFHSIAQVIYGGSLGFCVYALLFLVLCFHQINVQQYRKLFTKLKCIILISIIYFFVFGILLLTYLLFKHYQQAEYESNPNIQRCEKAEHRHFFNDGFFGGLTIFCLIGHYYGQVLFWKLISKNTNLHNKHNDINLWVDNRMHVFTDIKKLLKTIGIILLSAIPFVLYVIPFKGLAIVYVFKIAVPFFVCLFNFYGGGLYLMISKGCCNKNLC